MMTLSRAEHQIEHVNDMSVFRRAVRLTMVVGLEGTKSACGALDASALLISGRVGTVKVVCVPPITLGVEMSATTLAESLHCMTNKPSVSARFCTTRGLGE